VCALLIAAAAAGGASGASRVRGTETVACGVRSFAVVFAPRRNAVVSTGAVRLGAVSFTSQWLSPSCRRVAQQRPFSFRALAGPVRRSVRLRCAGPKPIRIRVHPILNGDTNGFIGSVLIAGIGTPPRAVVSVVLKNRGDPQASRIYWSRSYCTAS
jgi:hypothetical protein